MAAKFGELVVDLEFITEEQLDEALALQKNGRAKLGKVMLHMRMLTSDQVDKVLAHQAEQPGTLFGACSLELVFVTEEKLAKAVRYQTTSKGFLGEILIEMGYLTEEQRLDVTRHQMF